MTERPAGLDMYRYLVVDPGHPQEALRVLGQRDTLGIEMTDPGLASACILGNLDPQHGPDRRDQAAIQAALDADLPAPGSQLATIRPDLDAFGAMAILALRQTGEVDGSAPPDLVMDRVEEIATVDKGPRSWPGPGPTGTGATAAVGLRQALASVAADASLGVKERVARVAEWLMTGSFAESDAAVAALAARRREALETTEVTLAAAGRIVVIRSASPLALSLGYEVAPVVVAENPRHQVEAATYRKLTVAQSGPGWVDLDAVAAELNEMEPGWGGSATIKGSPQGRPSRMELDAVVAIVERHLSRDRPWLRSGFPPDRDP